MMTETSTEERQTTVSSNIKDNFGAYNIPFIGCDYGDVYPLLLSVIPQEKVSFLNFDLNTAIMCEIISAAICHQINWDFLREALYKYTLKDKKWLDSENLSSIKVSVIEEMLGKYHRVENIKADERARMIRSLGIWTGEYNQVKDIFLESSGKLKPIQVVKVSLLKCPAFASDPEEKKLNLLFQKLDSVSQLHGIGDYSKPAIDYHLLRLYLRRGLLYARTKYANEYITNPDVYRKEGTVAGVRELTANLMNQISLYTGLSILSVNLIDWHVGRSVCDRENPDCKLCGEEAQWLKPVFNRCPFYKTCATANQTSDKLRFIKEPSYKGTSY